MPATPSPVRLRKGRDAAAARRVYRARNDLGATDP